MGDSNLLQDKAFSEIRKKIQNGTYPPGTKLVTQEISDSLNISRTPVVAAINRLIAIGIVENIPNRGTIVAQVTPRRIMEATDIRAMIETFCVNYVVKNAKFFPEVIAEMREDAERLKVTNDLNEACELEIRFHTNYVRLSGNQTLVNFYETNWSIGLTYLMWSAMKQNMEALRPSLCESEHILELCLSGDTEKLREMIKHHLDIVYDTVNWYIRFSGAE